MTSLPIVIPGVFRGTKTKSHMISRVFHSSPFHCMNGRTPRPSTLLKVHVPHQQKSFDLKWKLGDSLKKLAEENDDLMEEYIEGTCGGKMSCSTCHVYIYQTEFQAFLEEPEDVEKDMLVRGIVCGNIRKKEYSGNSPDGLGLTRGLQTFANEKGSRLFS